MKNTFHDIEHVPKWTTVYYVVMKKNIVGVQSVQSQFGGRRVAMGSEKASLISLGFFLHIQELVKKKSKLFRSQFGAGMVGTTRGGLPSPLPNDEGYSLVCIFFTTNSCKTVKNKCSVSIWSWKGGEGGGGGGCSPSVE